MCIRDRDRKGNRTRQKDKRGDSKVESNDSPEIQDRGETSDIPSLPSGLKNTVHNNLCTHFFTNRVIKSQNNLLSDTKLAGTLNIII